MRAITKSLLVALALVLVIIAAMYVYREPILNLTVDVLAYTDSAKTDSAAVVSTDVSQKAKADKEKPGTPLIFAVPDQSSRKPATKRAVADQPQSAQATSIKSQTNNQTGSSATSAMVGRPPAVHGGPLLDSTSAETAGYPAATKSQAGAETAGYPAATKSQAGAETAGYPAATKSQAGAEAHEGPKVAINEMEKLYQARRMVWQGQYDQAIRLYQELIQNVPTSADYQGELGNVYYSRGMYAEATDAYEAAARLLIKSGDMGRAWQVISVIRTLDSRRANQLDNLLIGNDRPQTGMVPGYPR
ncbi:MAG: hypothetical protein BMS9Abin15_0305 [Gammaproteobacteria bacterium]|nr:MAG: hypothetical protein BMS9Abin15_0305 [Gammaproteobacteria bacterium]